jgi:hypothetical protein
MVIDKRYQEEEGQDYSLDGSADTSDFPASAAGKVAPRVHPLPVSLGIRPALTALPAKS